MKQGSCGYFRCFRVLGIVGVAMVSSSCFYVWQEPIRYGQTGVPGGQQAEAEPGTLDELKAQRERQEAEKLEPEVREQPRPEPKPAPKPAPKPPQPEAAAIPTAKKVPGRDGFVFSPYNNKLIDVKGFPSGAKVRDPHYAASENKFFRVP